MLQKHHLNPVIPNEDLADPAVIKFGDLFYLYPTCPGFNQFDVYVSQDLMVWQKAATTLKLDSPNLWAPDVYFDPEGKHFYLYYSANFNIGVAIADNPLGPFIDQGILIENAIDAHLFKDDDGSIYLFYERINPKHDLRALRLPTSALMVQTMQDFVTLQGPPKVLLEPEGWEKGLFAKIVEAPWMIKRQGIYYLMYSGNVAPSTGYGIGYATSQSPMGPFVRFKGNPIVSSKPGVIGPGHHAVIEKSPEEYWIIYHQKISKRFGLTRRVCIDRLYFNNDNTITVNTTPICPEDSTENILNTIRTIFPARKKVIS